VKLRNRIGDAAPLSIVELVEAGDVAKPKRAKAASKKKTKSEKAPEKKTGPKKTAPKKGSAAKTAKKSD
jgi:hypothetical protein